MRLWTTQRIIECVENFKVIKIQWMFSGCQRTRIMEGHSRIPLADCLYTIPMLNFYSHWLMTEERILHKSMCVDSWSIRPDAFLMEERDSKQSLCDTTREFRNGAGYNHEERKRTNFRVKTVTWDHDFGVLVFRAM